jgi:hypothetical protein
MALGQSADSVWEQEKLDIRKILQKPYHALAFCSSPSDYFNHGALITNHLQSYQPEQGELF